MTKKNKNDDPEAAAIEEIVQGATDKELPIPDYIFKVLFERMDTLDMQINAMSQKLDKLNAEYSNISKFVKEYKCKRP